MKKLLQMLLIRGTLRLGGEVGGWKRVPVGEGRGGVWGRQGATSPTLLREEHVRARSNVNLVTLGAAGHGKTLLASRLAEVLARHGNPRWGGRCWWRWWRWWRRWWRWWWWW